MLLLVVPFGFHRGELWRRADYYFAFFVAEEVHVVEEIGFVGFVWLADLGVGGVDWNVCVVISIRDRCWWHCCCIESRLIKVAMAS